MLLIDNQVVRIEESGTLKMTEGARLAAKLASARKCQVCDKTYSCDFIEVSFSSVWCAIGIYLA